MVKICHFAPNAGKTCTCGRTSEVFSQQISFDLKRVYYAEIHRIRRSDVSAVLAKPWASFYEAIKCKSLFSGTLSLRRISQARSRRGFRILLTSKMQNKISLTETVAVRVQIFTQ